MPYVRKAVPQDGTTLGPRLRDADKSEATALLGMKPSTGLILSIASSDQAWAGCDDDGTVLGAWGAKRTSDVSGMVWMLSSDELFVRYKRRFIKDSKEWIEKLHEDYRLLHNVIDERNRLHIFWLEKVGFQFVKRLEGYGMNGETFLEFVKIKDID